MSTTELPDDRRRLDRRSSFVRLSDYTVPELRKAAVSITLLVVISAFLIYMLKEVFVAVTAGIVAGAYLLPVHAWLTRRTNRSNLSAVLTIVALTVPVIAILTYSWIEIAAAARYLDENTAYILRRLTQGLSRVPYLRNLELSDDLPRWLAAVGSSTKAIVEELRETIDAVIIGFFIFLFTTFYILTDHVRISSYIQDRIPGRYRTLTDPITGHVKAVVYGVLYGTFLTQLMKSVLILTMNLIWNVPLAVVLAIVSFFLGLLPIVGSWSVYTPVAIYLMLWRGNVIGGVVMIVIGLLFNTILISTYLRPKIAAEKSHVLNFYWMFVALVTGVYTFGLMGIIIGPVLIAILKAILDTLTLDLGYPEDEPLASAAHE